MARARVGAVTAHPAAKGIPRLPCDRCVPGTRLRIPFFDDTRVAFWTITNSFEKASNSMTPIQSELVLILSDPSHTTLVFVWVIGLRAAATSAAPICTQMASEDMHMQRHSIWICMLGRRVGDD